MCNCATSDLPFTFIWVLYCCKLYVVLSTDLATRDCCLLCVCTKYILHVMCVLCVCIRYYTRTTGTHTHACKRYTDTRNRYYYLLTYYLRVYRLTSFLSLSRCFHFHSGHNSCLTCFSSPPNHRTTPSSIAILNPWSQ